MQEIDDSRLKLATPPQNLSASSMDEKGISAAKKEEPSARPKSFEVKSYFKKAGGFQSLTPQSSVKTFAVSEKSSLEDDDTYTVLPAGSFVKAKVVSGVEANSQEPYPVLLQLEYAFKGPNGSKIDLSNCFMIAKARANLSTERVIMETETLSCVVESGEHFKTQARGYTAGEDSSFGSTGTFISKQGQVLLAAVLANVAKNAGEAIALAQQTTQVVGADKAAAATNVTGNKAAFVAGKSVVDGATMIAQWYLDYAKQLIPSIGIGSGQDVHVVMLESIKVPDLKE
jgi:conjugal transfer pilus assembly protein TraB